MMHKAFSELDDQERHVLLMMADFAIATFSSALVVGIIQGVVSVLT
jgi:hypothetical protein